MVEQIVAAIREHAHTGKKGDGIILVVPIENAVLI
jgi:nitrogen regulatory protein PII